MLEKLEIQNYILIDHLEIPFSTGLSVITGETGAGKSIIMGALGLILGDRADSMVCRNPEKKCFVEGVFKLQNTIAYKSFFEANELEINDELIIRREINAQGKSRAFINDSPVNLQILKQLTSELVDLHQQFDTLSLGDTQFQRSVVDSLAGLQNEIKDYQLVFTEWRSSEKTLSQLLQQKATFEESVNYKKHLLEELTNIQLKENELEDLEKALKVLENAVEIKSQLEASVQVLENAEQPIVQQLKQLVHNLNSIAKWQPDLEPVLNRLNATQIELADISTELEKWQDKINLDDQKIIQIQERLSLGYSLQKKHKVQSTEGLLNIQRELEKDLEAVLSIDEQIEKLMEKVKHLFNNLQTKAAVLSERRSMQIAPFTKQVNALLNQVGMPNAKIKLSVESIDFDSFGKDKIDILFDANNTQKFEPIRKVASGGELSRLMLCIKSLVAKSMDLPTMIFDEIDTGISGEPAKQVGLLLQNLGMNKQVICITHQPQIAAKGNTHLYVYKEQDGKTTHTHLKTLDNASRIQHIASMIGGDPPTKTAIENAKELLA